MCTFYRGATSVVESYGALDSSQAEPLTIATINIEDGLSPNGRTGDKDLDDELGSRPRINDFERNQRIMNENQRHSADITLRSNGNSSLEKKKGMIDLRGLERFDAPSNMSPHGSWIGSFAAMDKHQRGRTVLVLALLCLR